MWHVDTNHKLILYNLVIHGCVDGYSRLLIHLTVTTDNLALTSLNIYLDSVKEYVIPARIRADNGGEFNHIASFQDNLDGTTRLIRGKSVHNTRIERIWRDTREKVVDKYKYIFMHMEDNGVLDVNNDRHMFCLHYVYQPRINTDLQFWRDAWNNHGLRTMQHQSPNQLWVSGVITNENANYFAMDNIFRCSSADRDQVISNFRMANNFDEPDDINVVLPRIPAPLTDAEYEELKGTVNPLGESDCGGIDLYGQVVTFVYDCAMR